MAKRELTLADLFSPEVAAEASKVTQQALGAAKQRGLTLEDITGKAEEPADTPMSGKNTLKATVPLPGEWPTYDTGLPISQPTAQMLAGAGKRFVDVQNRAKQGVNKVAPQLFKGVQADIDEAATRDAPLMATTPGMLGNMLPDVVATGRAPMGPLATSGKLGVAQGLSLPVTSNDQNGTAFNVGVGGLGGAAGHAVATGASNLLGKTLHAAPELIPQRARDLAGKLGLSLPETTWTDAEKRRLFLLAKSKGVPLTIGDLAPTSEWASIENANRPFWSGRTGDMQKQQDATRQVLEDLSEGLSSPNPGTDNASIVKGIKDKYNGARTESSAKFQLVKDIAGRSPGLTPIVPERAYMATKSALADYPELFDEFKNSPQISKMLGLQEDVGPQNGLIINPKNMKPFKYEQQLGFDDAQFLRKRLGAWYDKLDTQFKNGTLPAGLDGEAVKHAASIFSAFNKDLDAWGKQSGNKALNDAWSDARGYFKENVLPFRDPSKLGSKTQLLRKIINDDIDVDTVANKVLPASDSSVAGDVMAHSTPAGQAAVKSAAIGRMVDPSISPDIQGLGNASLLRNTAKQAHAGDYIFSPEELQQIKDARDIVGLTRRSAEAGTTPPPTGARTLPFMAASGLAGTAGAAYMGLGMLGDAIDPATRLALAGTVAPAGVLGVMRGLNRYAGSNTGQNMHFANPKLKGVLGALQDTTKRSARGAGEPWLNAYLRGELGHRE